MPLSALLLYDLLEELAVDVVLVLTQLHLQLRTEQTTPSSLN